MTDDHTVDDSAPTDVSPSTTRAVTAPPAGVSITFTPEREPRRRIQYAPRPDVDGWWRITHEWTGCTWRIVGREPLVGSPSLAAHE